MNIRQQMHRTLTFNTETMNWQTSTVSNHSGKNGQCAKTVFLIVQIIFQLTICQYHEMNNLKELRGLKLMKNFLLNLHKNFIIQSLTAASYKYQWLVVGNFISCNLQHCCQK